MRRALVLGLLVLLSLAGCIRPLARGAEPDRESAHAPPTLFGAAALWLNGTGHVSEIPPQVAALVDPTEPHNCFSVRSTKDDAVSYLSGVLIEMDWSAASTSTRELNVTVRGPPQAPATWSFQGPSPFRLSAEAGDARPIRTPFTVEVRAPRGGVPVPQQVVAFHVG
ncbi:MAG: hypothetical protein QOC71_234, partial [Thermoplasmata archaeon]|nr:hypothetical protein [Thermoplasmata archaeon]